MIHQEDKYLWEFFSRWRTHIECFRFAEMQTIVVTKCYYNKIITNI